MRRTFTACVLLLPLLLVTALVYWPGLHGPLLLDDLINLEVLAAYEEGHASAADVITGYGESFWHRPVAMASFLADQTIHGGRVWALKYTNLMIHLLCGTLLFWLGGRLLRHQQDATAEQAWWLALWVAALWLTAPLLVSTVLYTVQRMAQLAALFTILGLLSYVLGRERLARAPLAGWALIAAAFGLCWPLAFLSKENGILMPYLVLVVEVFFLRRVSTGRAGPVLRLLLGAATVIPAILAIAYLASHWGAIEAGYRARDFGPWERLLTQAHIMVDYVLGLLSLPGASPMGIYRDDYPILTAPFQPPFPALLAAAWAGLAAIAWRLRHHPVGPLLGGMAFFMTGHLVESTLLPLELYFEHRNYLPAVGVFLGLAAVMPALLRRLVRLHRLVVAAMVALVALNLGLTAARADIWTTKESLLDYHLATHPTSVRTRAGAANLLLTKGHHDAALAQLDAAAAAAHGTRDAAGVALHRLAVMCHAGQGAAATSSPLPPFADAPYTVNALGWLVEAVERGNCPGFPLTRLLDHLAAPQPLEDRQRRWNLLLFEARLAVISGDTERAVEHFLEAHALRPRRPAPALRAARLWLEAGKAGRARAVLEDIAPAAHAWAPAWRGEYLRLGERADRSLSARARQADPGPSGTRASGPRP